MWDDDELYQIWRSETISKMLNMCQWIHEEELVSHVNHPCSQELVKSWIDEHKIFGVSTPRGILYPAFQFDSEVRPRAIVKEILSEFGNKDPVSIAAWFLFKNGWISMLIDGVPESVSPVRALDDGEAILNAAKKEVKSTHFS